MARQDINVPIEVTWKLPVIDSREINFCHHSFRPFRVGPSRRTAISSPFRGNGECRQYGSLAQATVFGILSL
jgi:hypothetical protein